MIKSKEIKITLGKLVEGEGLLEEYVEGLPHLLIAGGSQENRSNLLNRIADDIKENYKTESLVIDAKAEDLEKIYADMQARYDKFAEYICCSTITDYNEKALAKGESRLPKIIVALDEKFSEILENKRYKELVRQIVMKGRASGVYLIATLGEVSTVKLNEMATTFPSRLVFKPSEIKVSEALLNSDIAKDLLEGEAYFLGMYSSAPTKIKG